MNTQIKRQIEFIEIKKIFQKLMSEIDLKLKNKEISLAMRSDYKSQQIGIANFMISIHKYFAGGKK